MIINTISCRRKCFVFFVLVLLVLFGLLARVMYLIAVRGPYYLDKAQELQSRERTIVAPRGLILDRNGKVLADNKQVYTIYVIHNQIDNPEEVIRVLSSLLKMDEEYIRQRVEKISAIEKIKANVSTEVGEEILAHNLSGVKVDAAYARSYPYSNLASKLLGFTGSDNQGIIGLEAKYNDYLKGADGQISSITDARGVELDSVKEERIEPKAGADVILTLDYNIQKYILQAAEKTYLQKSADSVEIIVMNPQNGEILGMVDYPEFDLSEPFKLENGIDDVNLIWRNRCISDTYEPGSIFKIITASIALEENLVALDEHFYCPGYINVEDRRIRCHKTSGHGTETFVEGIENSCNPVFIDLELRIGASRFYDYFSRFELLEKTEIDLPGEASTIMHEKDNIGAVELATISFGQSFQLTPIRLVSTVSALINGGNVITPHLCDEIRNQNNEIIYKFESPTNKNICSKATSATMRELLEKVVSEGGGNKAYIEGYEIGGKTATSQTFPRSDNKYISSFLGYAPADNPQIMVLVVINNPEGAYYGGIIAAPVAKEIFENVLPYVILE